MFGFTITVNGKVAAGTGDINYNNIVCSNQMIHKFDNDKIFQETDEYIFILDGIILNRDELVSNNKGKLTGDVLHQVWFNTLKDLYVEKGEKFFSVLRGSFAGALYDKRIGKWIIFGDQIGSKYIFYAKVGEFFCCTQVMGHIYDMLHKNGVDYHIDEDGAWMLLTYGYMLDNYTLCKEVRKINPGCYLTIQDGKVEEHRYYLLDNTPDNKINEHDAIEIVDQYFRQAVIRQFEKDREYGYKHLVALSGGLDCRMTTFVSHDCGYTNQLNMTFSQSDYWDQILPMRMSAALKHEWIFKALDNGLWLYDIDEMTKVSGGNVIYYGTAHSNSLYKYLNFSSLGLLHSGQIGDVIIGSFITAKDKDKEYKIGGGAYSNRFLNNLRNTELSLKLNLEIGLFYYRAFHGTNNGLQNLYNYTETLSPFLDLDMLEKSLSIPVELRQKHYLYKKWILAKYPKAAEFEWEKTGSKITSKMVSIRGREMPLNKVFGRFYRYAQIKTSKNGREGNLINMNPIGYYITHNADLQQYLNDYFQYIDVVENKELRAAIQEMYNNGNATEKLQVVSLLSAIKLFYN